MHISAGTTCNHCRHRSRILTCGVTLLFSNNRKFSLYFYPTKEFIQCTFHILYHNQSNLCNLIFRRYGLSSKFWNRVLKDVWACQICSQCHVNKTIYSTIAIATIQHKYCLWYCKIIIVADILNLCITIYYSEIS